jgi:hypothetical protein
VRNHVTLTARVLPGIAIHSTAIALVGAAIACLAAGCSPGADYPSIFPAVHDMPPPRAEAPLDPQQVQRATEDLIGDRNRLNGEAQGAPGKASANPAPKPPNSATAAKKTPAKPSPAATGNQTAGAETK